MTDQELRDIVTFLARETRRNIGLGLLITTCMDLVTLALVYYMVNFK
jgi:hypothetical protein